MDPYDYTRPGKEELRRRILLAAKPGCIVLLHAGVSDTIDVLPGIIASLRERGSELRYSSVTSPPRPLLLPSPPQRLPNSQSKSYQYTKPGNERHTIGNL